MKFLFIVQGEGRGHMTQAITLSNILQENGHEVVGALIGKSQRREIPSFFFQKINCKTDTIDSPNFILGHNNKRVQIVPTLLYNLLHGGKFVKSIIHINRVVKQTKPDVIVNFYELLCGLYFRFYKPSAKHICIGHQFLIHHPQFHFPKNHVIDKYLLFLNTWITGQKAHKKLALSFTELDDIPAKKAYTVPPLIRRDVMEAVPEKKNYLSGYMLNSGYSEEIVSWHNAHDNEELHFFWDQKDAIDDTVITKNLTFHKINDIKFIQYLKDCKAFASTAGFESVCEAMYLGKPMMMIPTEGHYEQMCNALDAANAGAGIVRDRFDLSGLLDFVEKYEENTRFKAWVKKSKTTFLHHLTS